MSDAPRIAASASATQLRGWRVLVVESHCDDAEKLAHNLRRHGHEVNKVSTGGEALQVFDHSDLVLIDLDLPDLDGLEVCRSIRVVGDTPVIAVTGRGSELDCVLGLQAGADDYLVKPYGFRELMARIEAVMRRIKPKPRVSIISHGQLEIDVTARQVTVSGRVVQLTRKEFQLLYLLASHAGSVVTRRQLMAQVWGGSWSRRTLDTHISSLRNKLDNGDSITTIRGIGFRLERMLISIVGIANIIDAYIAAWNEPDVYRRRGFLQLSWADDGLYCDPTGMARGREEFVAHIAGFQKVMPGRRFELTTAVDEHDGYLRFGWAARAHDGNVAMAGMDFGTLASDGRLAQIVGFFGPLGSV